MHYVRRVVKEEERKKSIFEVLFFLGWFVFLFSLGILLYLFSEDILRLTGYAPYLNATGGEILPVHITVKLPTTYWHGIYGLALRVPGFTEQLSNNLTSGEITRQDLFFDCIQSGVSGGNEVFAALVPNISFSNITAGTRSMVDAFLNCSQGDDCANNTFTGYMNVSLGNVNITNVPATYTYKYDGNNTAFDIGVLNASGNIVFVTHISSLQRGFSQSVLVNFQMLLPTPTNSSPMYHFFTDPNDVCPQGGIGDLINANIYGFVRDNKGNLLQNITVSLGGASVLSDSNGSYNLTTLLTSGTYVFVAFGNGYDPFIDNVTISFTNYSFYRNITINASTPGLNGTITPNIFGYVKDANGVALQGANVSLGGFITSSNASGFYNMTPVIAPLPAYIIAIKEGYNNYYALLNFSMNTSFVYHNITMVAITTAVYFTGPYATGPYTAQPGSQQQPSVQVPPQVKIEGLDFWIASKEIRKEVRQNTFVEETVSIYNLRNTGSQMFFSLPSSLGGFVELDRESLSLSPRSSGNLIVTIYGNRPLGVYYGNLTVSGDIKQVIPLIITVVENKFPIENLLLEIDLLDEAVRPGGKLNYRVRMQNFLIDQSYAVFLKHSVSDMNYTRVYASEDESIEIKSSATLLKSLQLPDDITPGDYLIQVDTKYLNFFSSTSAVFQVREPLYLYAFIGIPLWMWFLVLTGLSGMLVSGIGYKRYRDRKKRYLVPISYEQLPRAGDRAIKVGKLAETNVPAYFDLDKLTTHTIVAGSTGMGKSIAAQVIIEEALQKGISVIVFDPTAQWSGMLRKCDDKRMIDFYGRFGLKPGDAKAFNGNIRQVGDVRETIDVNKYKTPGEIQVFAINRLDPKDIDVFIANVIRQVFASNPQESAELKMLLVFDEVHRLLSKFGGSGEGFLQIERACREFRKWGIGLILISQVLSDFVGEIKANINTEIQARTVEETDLERIRVKYGGEILRSLVKSAVGVTMVQNAEYNKGRPYFVNFRPILHSTKRLSDQELEKYNTYNQVYDDLEYQVEQLDKEKVDVFDFKMELKLVLDKIKQGNFSVVDIYLEGLKPRLEGAWKKLGKKPKKKELVLVDISSIKKSVEEAKKAKATKRK